MIPLYKEAKTVVVWELSYGVRASVCPSRWQEHYF